MKTKAIRLYGKEDLRLDEIELPAINDDEILAKVVSDSICMSSYKAAKQGTDHKRVPKNAAEEPVMIGHEFAGTLVEVGKKWKGKFSEGMKFSIQPALNFKNGPVGILSAPGYSYKYIGGDSQYIIIPKEVMEQDCLLAYNGEGYYPASLAEPLSCVIGAIHANYHNDPGSYVHKMDIKEGGNMAILAGAGPMGLAAINYVINRTHTRPGKLVVTDIDQVKLDRAAEVYTVEHAAKNNIELSYLNTANDDPVKQLLDVTDNYGFDDVFVFAPVPAVIELADSILAENGCLNFFAGPSKPDFTAKLNFYNVHYKFTHIAGTSGGNNEDLREALDYLSKGLDPAGLITHIGGLNAVIDATLRLPEIPGGKKLIYTHIDLPLTAIDDLAELGKNDAMLAKLSEIVAENNGLWSVKAEKYLLENAKSI